MIVKRKSRMRLLDAIDDTNYSNMYSAFVSLSVEMKLMFCLNVF